MLESASSFADLPNYLANDMEKIHYLPSGAYDLDFIPEDALAKAGIASLKLAKMRVSILLKELVLTAQFSL